MPPTKRGTKLKNIDMDNEDVIDINEISSTSSKKSAKELRKDKKEKTLKTIDDIRIKTKKIVVNDKPKQKIQPKPMKNIRTGLSRTGYSLIKEDLSPKELNTLRKELTVTPQNSFGGKKGESYNVYLENDKKIYIPKFYGLNLFGEPQKTKIFEGAKTNMKFTGGLRDEQLEPVNMFLENCKDPEKMGGLLNLPCGMGKCFAKETPIMMYDGSVKMVEDIRPKDVLMGDDNTERRVQSICKGYEQMYKIVQEKGGSYTVNEPHILSLITTDNIKKDIIVSYLYDDHVVGEGYVMLPGLPDGVGNPGTYTPEPFIKGLYGYKKAIDFVDHRQLNYCLEIDPYIFGRWIYSLYVSPYPPPSQTNNVLHLKSDTCKRVVNNILKTNPVSSHLMRLTDCHYQLMSTTSNGVTLNILDAIFYKYFKKDSKNSSNIHIPKSYKYSTIANRQRLVSGILDGMHVDGRYGQSGRYDLPDSGDKKLRSDIIFVFESLGYYTMNHKTVLGNPITQLKIGYTKQNGAILQFPSNNPQNLTKSQIKIVKKYVDTYYGFEIDMNRRFLLGDGTVVHNTVMALYIAAALNVKTLVICHKDFLMKQWKERIEQYLENCNIGLIKQKKVEIEGKDLVLGSLQSLSMREYPSEIFDDFGLVIIDECHRSASEVFSKALHKINFKYALGLSATLTRSDGLIKIIKWFIGDVIFKKARAKDKDVDVHIYDYYVEDIAYSTEYTMMDGSPNTARMLNNICAYKPRTSMMIKEIQKIFDKEPQRKMLLLSNRREHLNELNRRLNKLYVLSTNDKDKMGKEKNKDKMGKEKKEKKGHPARMQEEDSCPQSRPNTVGFYVGGMKEKDLKASESCDIILATYSMAAEGLDIPGLNTLVLGSPISSIEQSVGRILRQKKEDRTYKPLILDIVDKFSIFAGQSKRRNAFYKKQGYEMKHVHRVTDYDDSVKEMERSVNRVVTKLTRLDDVMVDDDNK
jgi:superfamily II DNA or RNA helicase